MSAETSVPLMTHHSFSTIPVQQTGESICSFVSTSQPPVLYFFKVCMSTKGPTFFKHSLTSSWDYRVTFSCGKRQRIVRLAI